MATTGLNFALKAISKPKESALYAISAISWLVIISCFIAFYVHYNNNADRAKEQGKEYNDYPDTQEGINLLNTGFAFLVFFVAAYAGVFGISIQKLAGGTDTKVDDVGVIILSLVLCASFTCGAVAVGERDKKDSMDSEDIQKLSLAALILFIIAFFGAPIVYIFAAGLKQVLAQ